MISGDTTNEAVRPLFIVNVEGVILRGERYLMILRGEGEGHAAGTLSMPGGKVELNEIGDDVLERALEREISEEVGLEVLSTTYLESKAFIADDGEPVVDTVFLCACAEGEPSVTHPEGEVFDHPKTPPWIRQSVAKAELRRSKP